MSQLDVLSSIPAAGISYSQQPNKINILVMYRQWLWLQELVLQLLDIDH